MRSDEDSNFIGSEINQYVEKPYQELKAGKYKVNHVNSKGLVGEYLRKEGKLKTISDHVEEGAQDTNKIVAKLINEIGMKNENLDELHYKYNEKTMSLSRMLEEKDMLHHAFYEGFPPRIMRFV
ncbi:unnamed protein product [Thlaspi arvense]|uniref:Uncharacterized protein n=1 Tax=Thlaspi arvense TaxID=13288 RepID=A0AAU9RSP2_THLAR|nr:unnamed protein product [Thlaspi arvense]